MRRQLLQLIRLALLSLMLTTPLLLGGCDGDNNFMGGGGVQELIGGEGEEDGEGDEDDAGEEDDDD